MLPRLAMVVLALVATATLSAAAEPTASLADGRDGRIEFESITPAGFFALVRRSPSPRITVYGVLTLPPGERKVPAMVIAHGSGGISEAREGRWTSRLTAIGIAAFYVDSFGPRGIKDTVTDQSQLPRPPMSPMRWRRCGCWRPIRASTRSVSA